MPVQNSFRICSIILALSGFKSLDYIPYRSGNPVANQLGLGCIPKLFSQCMSNPSLNENVTHQEASEAANPVEVMDLEANTSPTEAAQASLQNLGLGEKEKHEKELAICSQLLDQVRGYFVFDRVTRSKTKNDPVTHNDLERALQCSSHLALKHAEAYGSVHSRDRKSTRLNSSHSSVSRMPSSA